MLVSKADIVCQRRQGCLSCHKCSVQGSQHPDLALSWCRLDSESFVAVRGGPNKNKKQLEKAAGGRERASLLRVRLCKVFMRLLLLGVCFVHTTQTDPAYQPPFAPLGC